jgi:fumarate reductase flavoprotein subunit
MTKEARRSREFVAQNSGATVEWLADRYGFPFSLVHDFDYPGHSARRMHGLPSRSGAGTGLTGCMAPPNKRRSPSSATPLSSALFADSNGAVRGFEITRPAADAGSGRAPDRRRSPSCGRRARRAGRCS